MRARSAEGLVESEERGSVRTVALLSGNLWPQGTNPTHSHQHFFPCRIGTLEAIFRVAHSAMIEVNLAYESSTSALIIDGILELRRTLLNPLKELFCLDLDLSPISKQVNSVLILVQIPLHSEPTINPALAHCHAASAFT
jgi:hypothetical protein